MTLSSAIEKFLMENKPRLAKQTYINYQSDLGLLVALARVHASDTVLAFSRDLVRRFFFVLSEKGLSMATLHRRRATLNEFGKWGLRERYWVENPMIAAPRIKRPRRLPRPFAPDERARLLALELPLQERVIRAALYYTGLRVSELCGIQLGDLTSGSEGRIQQIRIRGKGAKERPAYVVPELAELLRDYLLHLMTTAKVELTPETPLLMQPGGHPFERRMINRRLREWGRRAEVEKCSPHRWRHTTATVILERGGDIRKIQKVLGHADISSTAIYTDVLDAQIRDATMLLSDQPTGGAPPPCNPSVGGGVLSSGSVPPTEGAA